MSKRSSVHFFPFSFGRVRFCSESVSDKRIPVRTTSQADGMCFTKKIRYGWNLMERIFVKPGLSLLLGRGHTKETGNRNATATSENCYQPELNKCYWVEQRKLRKLAFLLPVSLVWPRLYTSELWTHSYAGEDGTARHDTTRHNTTPTGTG
jgi:hypothetical protein